MSVTVYGPTDVLDDDYRVLMCLISAGLVRNHPWLEESMLRAGRMYSDRDLAIAARCIAAADRYAIEYLEQAPVLAVAFLQNRDPTLSVTRLHLLARTKACFLDLPKLRDLLRGLRVAAPLRDLGAGELLREHYLLLYHFWGMNRSRLAQALARRRDRRGFLDGLAVICLHCYRRTEPERTGAERTLPPANGVFEWFCDNLPDDRAVGGDGNAGMTVADFFRAQPEAFNPAWSWNRAYEGALAWHERLARADQEEQFRHAHGPEWTWDRQVDCSPFPTRWEGADCVFTALRSGRELWEEGKAMHHCVASYARDVIRGTSRIYSIADAATGKRLATLDICHSMFCAVAHPYRLPNIVVGIRRDSPSQAWSINQTWNVCQLSGVCNAAPPARAVEATKKFWRALQEALTQEEKEKA